MSLGARRVSDETWDTFEGQHWDDEQLRSGDQFRIRTELLLDVASRHRAVTRSGFLSVSRIEIPEWR